MTKKLLNRKETCQLLGISTNTLIRMEQAGTLDGIRLSNSPRTHVYYSREQVEQLISVPNKQPLFQNSK